MRKIQHPRYRQPVWSLQKLADLGNYGLLKGGNSLDTKKGVYYGTRFFL
jgi:hypothetical protein